MLCIKNVCTSIFFAFHKSFRSCAVCVLFQYEKTRGSVYGEEGGLGVLVELMSIYREKVAIFTKLCTLLGILSLDTTCKQVSVLSV